MQGKKLKNYDGYRVRLLLFADALGVRVIFKELHESEGGEWMPHIRRINIEDDLPNSIEIASLLHELGHSLDELLYRKKKTENTLLDAYSAWNNGKHTKEQLDLVVTCEVRAWKCARNIAKRLNIKLGKWFYDFKSYCLKHYRQS